MKSSEQTSLAQRAQSAAREASAKRQTFVRLSETDSLKQALLAVKSWQAKRLAATYDDLLADPRHSPAARFFLDDLYGIHDLSLRDESVLRVLPSLVKFLPEAALKTIVEALEMDALSENLDWSLAQNLIAQTPESPESIAVSNPTFAQRYQQAYKTMEFSEQRINQIQMALKIGASLDKLVRQPLLGALLSTMSGPARLAGLSSIYDFLWRGFSAFKQMKGAAFFLQTIQTRETAEHERLLQA
jgi:L-fucose mutarotase/ribose pyranase (RbsD/FucU family)